MDVDAKATSVSDDGTMCSARADLDEEVADSDGSGSLGKIRSMLYPPPIPDVDDWGIPPESQKPCDPQVEVGEPSHRAYDAEKIGWLIMFLFLKGKTDAFPCSQK